MSNGVSKNYRRVDCFYFAIREGPIIAVTAMIVIHNWQYGYRVLTATVSTLTFVILSIGNYLLARRSG
jgi:hypothetical protein